MKLDISFALISIITYGLIGLLSGMNDYLATHTINPIEVKNKGITLVIPKDPRVAKIWHKKWDKYIQENHVKSE